MCCKPRRKVHQAGPATGPTTRLDEAAIDKVSFDAGRAWPARFPWWILWLIWPLLGLAKAIAPAVGDAIATLSQWSVPLLPLLLIAVGVALLLARRRDA